MSLSTGNKPTLAILTTLMDDRPGKGTAIVMRRQVEALVESGAFEVTLIHKTPTPNDPLFGLLVLLSYLYTGILGERSCKT